MAICDLVENIIQERHAKLPFIEKKKSELNEMKSLLHEFEAFKKRIVDADGNAIDGPFKDIADRNPDMVFNLSSLSTGECERKIEAALVECEKAYNRFSRESVNIAVIGKARIGKSRFLQSISNLKDTVIPAFEESDCTGAVSIIENKPGCLLEAHIKFKTEQQMVDIVQTYLDRIIPPEKGRIIVRSLYDIKGIDTDEIKNNRIEPGRPENNLIQYLKKFVEHFKDWAPLVAQKEIILTDEKEIQQYVAQHNGIKENEKVIEVVDGKELVRTRVNYYKYLAVDTCQIKCTFDYKEAGKITLVDTVGFEDNAIGIEDDLLKVVNEKSDAVVFILFPYDSVGGGVPKTIAEIYKKIHDSCKNKNLDKWLFWLINHAPNRKDMSNDMGKCNMAHRTLESNGWFGGLKSIVDVSEQAQVREHFLIPLLEILTANLPDIDELYLTDLKNALTDVRDAYSVFCQSAKKLMDSEYKNDPNGQTQIELMFYEVFNSITEKLKELAMIEKDKRETSCKELKIEIDKLIDKLTRGEYLPDKDTLNKQLKSGAQAQTLFIKYCNKIRTDITQDFAAVDTSLQKLVTAMKNSIANILISDECGKLGKILKPTDEEPYQWIERFADNVLMDSKSFPNLYPAFKNVQNFDFSVKGFLTYEVRACLDCLDPDLTNIPPIIGEDETDNIWFWLKKNLKDVSDLLYDRLYELLNKPNRAFFAFIKEFNDKVIYGNDSFGFGNERFIISHMYIVELEWKKLYLPNRFIIWPEVIKKMHSDKQSFEEWSELLKKLLEMNSKI